MYDTDIFDTSGDNLKVHNYNEVISIINKYSEDFSDTVTAYSIGKTVEGRQIPVIELHHEDKPVKGHIIIAAGHHGTEPAGVEAALSLMDKLVYADNEKAQYLLDNYQIDIIPAVNADMLARKYNVRIALPHKAAPYPSYRQYDNARGEPTNQYVRSQQINPLGSLFDEIFGDSFGSTTIVDPSHESKIVSKYVDKVASESDILLTIDYHETLGMDGFTLVRHANYESLGYDIITDIYNAGLPISRQKGHTPQGYMKRGILNISDDMFPITFSGYCEKRGSPHNLVFETPNQIAMKHRISMDLIGTEKAIDQLLFENNYTKARPKPKPEPRRRSSGGVIRIPIRRGP